MTTNPEGPIRNVSDTALWVAIYRAMESERADAIFSDPYARRLGGERGEEIVRAMPKGRAWAWPMIVRTAVMDEIVLRCIEQEGVRNVLNLAAGLDARPFRLPLPPSLSWFHIDLPEMVAYVQDGLGDAKPNCAMEFLSADLTDSSGRKAALDRAAEAGGPALAISEGLLVYLRPEQVSALARELASRDFMQWWLIDLAAPRLLKMLEKRWQPGLAAGNSAMIFAPEQGTAFFEPYGWREAEFRSTFEEALRLGRAMRGAWLWRLLSRLSPAKKREEMRRMSGIVLLERTAGTSPVVR